MNIRPKIILKGSRRFGYGEEKKNRMEVDVLSLNKWKRNGIWDGEIFGQESVKENVIMNKCQKEKKKEMWERWDSANTYFA